MRLAARLRRPIIFAKRYWAILVPVVVGLMAYGATRLFYFLGPVVEAPQVIDLGTHDSNKLVLTDVTVRNVGGRDLELSNFRGSCPSCLLFGLRTESGVTDLDHLSLSPGATATISARVTILGGPGRPFQVSLRCDTNDPRTPELVIPFEAKVRGRIIALPTSLDLGLLEVGQTIRRRVELRDTGRGEPFHFERAVSPDPAHVTVDHSADARSPGDSTTGGAAFGDLVSALDVTVLAPAAGSELNGDIAIYEAGRTAPTVYIPVRATVPPKLEVSPPSIVLPRRVGEADDYSAECSLSSSKGGPVRVSPDNVPPEVVITPSDPPAGAREGSRWFRVEWRADRRPTKGELRKVTVRFRVEVGSAVEAVEVPVRCLSPE
jgi:hypothetical protein